ncbi:hypothetical protein LTR08_000396 [Meristemomyces frigidus]|nr:hypothetical protein LTR08_000396 [Meristemomyces frigidus]
MPAAASNIRAFVQWKAPAVYAGEEIECVVTFRNVARAPGHNEEAEAQTRNANGHLREQRQSYAPSIPHSKKGSVTQGRPIASRAPSATSGRGLPPSRGHKPTLSLNVVSAPIRGGLHSAPLPGKAPHGAMKPAKSHGRSLSIMSLGSDAPSEGRAPTARRPARGHGRSASLQIAPRPLPLPSPGLGPGSQRQPSPLYESTTPPAVPESGLETLPIRPGRRRPGTVSANSTPQLGHQSNVQQTVNGGDHSPTFKFPAQPATPPSPLTQSERSRPPRSPATMHSTQQRPISPRIPEGWSGALSNLNPLSRVMSESSAGGTPRTSSELFSASNHSDETLTSEMPSQYPSNGRLLPKRIHSRQTSRSIGSYHDKPAEPETLMMGYAQTVGAFTLDGSLVNAAPFEEVKRKGVQGGGGVVGVERSKRSSGMFGAFSWGNIGESIGGLLGGDDMSSIAQLKASAGSKSVPLLSTPQSLLFVDLRLAPGESQSYSYRFVLPRGLPPSHRGRAIKVNYHLSIGVQRPDGQSVKQVEVPFRVLGSYNARGETLGHDLMSPYVLLHDAARTQSLAPDVVASSAKALFPDRRAQKNAKTPKQGLEEFLRYTERLLEQQTDAHGALLSPTSPTASPTLPRRQSFAEQPGSIKEAVDLAILRSNHVNGPGQSDESDAQSANRFNIARSGQPVAVLTLLRPAYRLGEAVIGTIDFTAPLPDSGMPPQVPTYAAMIELESAERVDPSLALRSSHSINRVTRKVHASAHENTIFARQIGFSLTVPSAATPTFETTGVSLAWNLRIEFTTQRQQVQGLGIAGQHSNGDEDLLEELGSDERGTVLIARERLFVETFEIAVPLKVFGAVGIDGVGGESEPLCV